MRASPLPGRKLCLHVGLRQPSHGPCWLGARRASPKSASFSAQYCEVSWFELEPQVLRRNLPGMMDDDPFDFRPRPGRVRNRDGRGSDSRSFLTQVMGAATKANGGPLKPARMRGERRSSARKRPGKGRCSRIGRGQTAADRLKRMAAERWPAERMRRVVVKARIVRLKVGSRVADAHVRYLQIVLQKSQVAERRFFRENTGPETIADSSSLTGVAEVACEFTV